MKTESAASNQSGQLTSENRSVAEAYLALLKDREIDYFYVGSGTDTASIVEAYAKSNRAAAEYPAPIIATHENLAVGMAHGYYMVSGKPQAVMLHVSVGAANAVCALMNAARAQVPMLFTAGRTPLFEQGRLGSRTSEIHWGQEMFDQGAMLREVVKWDYELRDGENLEQVVDRALNVSMAHPRGPVYLTLPREVLAQSIPTQMPGKRSAVPAAPHPDLEAVKALAKVMAKAKHPVIVCSSSGADPATIAPLVALCERHGIAVAEQRARYTNFPSSHPLHLGFDMKRVFDQADVLLFLESEVPWVPARVEPTAAAFVAHAGTDPIFTRYPIRSHRSDLTITATVSALLPALDEALRAAGAEAEAEVRTKGLTAVATANRKAVEEAAARDERMGGPITKTFLSRCLQAVRPADSLVLSEYSLERQHVMFDLPGTYFYISSSGGLGWGFPAALGAQQAAPDRTVIAVQGDGAYMFANPAVCHHAAAMHSLPVLSVVFNNAAWGAVSQAALQLYPNDYAARHAAAHGTSPLSSLEPMPDLEKYAEASGGYAERVVERDQLIPALERALKVVRTEKRQALVNVIGQG
ncbi:thiamine pyrophosphate-requiring protein [Bradyrhizobium sp. dw_78]|uniref:thiamine pyrophosphate-requiring protein n=1 Tax=Bradyrhizobium sp. dw_78 TaxID=2719793 RepID=UPI001BD5994B|nr:thiamine pyrophosphate-requiring protein [Bradyrhizobium sp. dw_78]